MTEFKNKKDSVRIKKKFQKSKNGKWVCDCKPKPVGNTNKSSPSSCMSCCTYPMIYKRRSAKTDNKREIKNYLKGY